MLETLRRQSPDQFVNFQHYVARVLVERGLPADGHANDPMLRRIDDRRFREILWQLLNQGILVQGSNSSNPQWPFLSLTEWGEEYVQSDGADVYDPDGYLRSLDDAHPLDDIERRYLAQAAAAFRADLADAASVMLGAAFEHLLLTLAQALIDHDPSAAKLKKAIDGPALGLLRETQAYLTLQRKKLSRRLQETLDTTFLGVASVIRASRNDAGHPALPQVERDDAFVVLRLYPNYREWIFRVIGELPL
jgi:hypothetical protein